jgi:cobalt-zinc-cadmium efflux system protein
VSAVPADALAVSQRRRLSLLLALNAGMIAVLVVVGLFAHSLGVLAAGGDSVTDSAAILLGIIAVTVRDRADGRSNATTWVALINGLLLVTITAWVISEAVHRLLTGAYEVHGLPVLLVSALATGVMLLGAVVLGRDAGREDLHMRSVMLDTLSDAATSAAVAVTGGIIWLVGGWYWLDSVAAISIGVVIGVSAVRLLSDVAHTLRTGSDLHLDED